MKKIDIDSIRITNAEFKSRIGRIQDALKEKKLDGLLVFASEAEPANVRYLADYWPSFETTGVLVPAEGKPCLLIGPESLTFAKSRSRIPDIRRLMDFRESSQPEYPGSKLTQWRDLLGEFKIGKLGITGMAMLPYPIWNNISAVLGEGNVASEETIVPGMRIIKSPAELQLLRGASKISEIGLEAALKAARPGMTEIELAAEAEYAMLKAGAETTGYPVWCCSGPNSNQAISRPTHRRIRKGELIQLCVGARIEGYSSSIGRVFVLGKISNELKKFVTVGLEAEKRTIDIMRAGRTGAEITKHVHDFIRQQGYGDCILYGPAHGVGLMECEFPFIESGLQMKLVQNMTFNIDIFLYTPHYGLRIEDGVIVRKDGVECMSGIRREIIVL
jgi:Xaa-Pro aminopeptidase